MPLRQQSDSVAPAAPTWCRYRYEFLRGIHGVPPSHYPRSRLWWLGFTLHWFLERGK